MTLGRAISGLNAYSKGLSLGLFEPSPEAVKAQRGAIKLNLLGRAVPCCQTDDGLRALAAGRTISPESVERYLQSKFGDDLEPAKKAMEKLARSITRADLAAHAYKLYEAFRPDIPAGVKGCGAAGNLNLDEIAALAA